MSHLSDEDLVLLHYGEAAGEAGRAHRESCAECAAASGEGGGRIGSALSGIVEPWSGGRLH